MARFPSSRAEASCGRRKMFSLSDTSPSTPGRSSASACACSSAIMSTREAANSVARSRVLSSSAGPAVPDVSVPKLSKSGPHSLQRKSGVPDQTTEVGRVDDRYGLEPGAEILTEEGSEIEARFA